MTKSKHRHLLKNIEKGYHILRKKVKVFLNFLEITYEMKKGMLFCLSHKYKRVEKTNLLHISVSTSKNFLNCRNRPMIPKQTMTKNQ